MASIDERLLDFCRIFLDPVRRFQTEKLLGPGCCMEVTCFLFFEPEMSLELLEDLIEKASRVSSLAGHLRYQVINPASFHRFHLTTRIAIPGRAPTSNTCKCA